MSTAASLQLFFADCRSSALGGPPPAGSLRHYGRSCRFRRAPRGSFPLCSSSSSSSVSPAIPTHGDDREEVSHVGEVQNSPTSNADATSEGNQAAKAHNTNELMQNLKRYGVAGVLSYGLFNTAYYLATFLVVWFYVAPAPARLGYVAAVERFIKLMAMVWAGSQVTKLIRVGGALALAPLVDKVLAWFTIKFKFESKAKACGVIAALCFGLALLVFAMLTLLWA